MGIDPFTPYNRCLEAGFEEKDIIMDIFYLSGGEPVGEADISNAW
jgi:hypothetical protein